jgi:hypothetical protein
MPPVELSPPARLALIGLLLIPQKLVTNTQLDEEFKIKIAKGDRERLDREGFITATRERPTSGPFYHELTATGRAQARSLLAQPAPANAKGAIADVRLLYAIGKVLDRVIRDYGLDEEKVFHPGEGVPEGKDGSVPTTGSSVAIDEQVMAAYTSLCKRHGDLVSLVRLRHQLSNIDRHVLDSTLKLMDRQRVIQLEPDPNQKALPPEAHDAALSIGGEDKHFITIGHR